MLDQVQPSSLFLNSRTSLSAALDIRSQRPGGMAPGDPADGPSPIVAPLGSWRFQNTPGRVPRLQLPGVATSRWRTFHRPKSEADASGVPNRDLALLLAVPISVCWPD